MVTRKVSKLHHRILFTTTKPWVFEHEVLQCAILKHATRWVLSTGWFDPHYPHGSQDFSLQLENSGVMKTLWVRMRSVVKTDSFLIPTVLFLLHFNVCSLRCQLDRKHGGCQADIGIRALVLIN